MSWSARAMPGISGAIHPTSAAIPIQRTAAVIRPLLLFLGDVGHACGGDVGVEDRGKLRVHVRDARRLGVWTGRRLHAGDRMVEAAHDDRLLDRQVLVAAGVIVVAVLERVERIVVYLLVVAASAEGEDEREREERSEQNVGDTHREI